MIKAKFIDDSDTFHAILYYIKDRLLHKARYNSKRLCKVLKQEEKAKKLYGRIKEKEKDKETETNNKTKRPFYYVENPNCSYGKLFRRLRQRGIKHSLSFKINQIQKI